MSSITLYRYSLSGHSHRVETFLSLLGLKAQIVDVDLANGAHKTTEFLSKNLLGQVPILVDKEFILSDSNAILFYLANKYDQDRSWFPANIEQAAEVQRFMSIAAGEIATGPAAARLITLFGASLDAEVTITKAHRILAFFEKHLEHKTWLVSEHPTIADIANYSYIAHAPEGNVSLEKYPNIKNWLDRIQGLQGFLSMPASRVGLVS